MARTPEEELPLKPVDFHILLVLTDGELHGYGMVKEIERRSDGRIRLEPGNLYRYLRRLVDAEMVEPAERRAVGGSRRSADARTGQHEPANGSDARRRRYYRVTPYGRRVLLADAARMRALAEAVEGGVGGA